MKVASVIGARPQFVKIAPLHPEISRKHEHVIIHTGQHYDYEMSQVFFEELKIPSPDYNLEVGSASHAEQTAKMLVAVEKVLLKEKPDAVIVYGDTNSTLAGALAAAKMLIPIAHVEAGLRSYRMDMPEEVNRVLTDHISSLLLCPSKVAVDNLTKEGIQRGVRLVGDTMIQCLREVEGKLDDKVLTTYGLRKQDYVLATIHRQDNTDRRDHLAAIVEALCGYEGTVVLPLHPRTAKNLRSWNLMSVLERRSNVKMLPPLNFLAFATLEKNAKIILTDSGGVQKEAYFFGALA